MDTAQILVTAFGALAIGWVVWFFFLGEQRAVKAATGERGVQEIDIRVKGGYSPDTIEVAAGKPVRLRFHREETDSCSDTVVLGDVGIRKPLPAFKTTEVEITPDHPGEYVFTCGMNMLRGKLIARDGERK